MLVTERPGRLRRVEAAGGAMSAPIEGLPPIVVSGQAGLFDVVVDPAFASNRRIYFSYAEPDGGANGTAVARAVLSADNARLESLTVILRQLPKEPGNPHYGGRLAFARDGTLFATLGERYNWRDQAQNPGNLLGKVVHITTDGAPAGAAPFAADPAAAAGLWSIGHRNPQGAAVHPLTGELWISEHGPQGGDEINRVTPGANYGWPIVSYGCEYGAPVGDACRIGGGTHAPNYVEPLTTWTPTSTATAGMTFVTGDRFPEWKGNLLVAALAGKAVWRLQLDGDAVSAREELFTDLGERIRDVREGPDGWLYLLTDEASGRIVRIQR
jgi:glucose/arabinose dehydrogenase